MRIKNNTAAQLVMKNLRKTGVSQEKHYEQLSSGKRINKASDDAAGLSLATHMKAQVRSMNAALRNANDGVSFIQTAEGGLVEISNILTRLRELTIQAGSDTVGDRERNCLEKEYSFLMTEIDRIAEATTYNGTNVINGQGQGYLNFHVGIYSGDKFQVQFDSDSANTSLSEIGIDNTSVKDKMTAIDSIEQIDSAINGVNGQRSELGAVQSRLNKAINNLEETKVNHDQSRSRVEDVDVADATAKIAADKILVSSGISMLSSANVLPETAIKLIK